VEILSHFNAHCTIENLRAKRALREHEQPTIEQLCQNFMNEGGNVTFRKKMAAHPEFIKQEEPELIFEDGILNKKNIAA
jgi:hypothetical protein